jgi:hypothetical protein
MLVAVAEQAFVHGADGHHMSTAKGAYAVVAPAQQ